jgi:hypothetical protein
MDTHEDSEDVLINGQIALNVISAYKEHRRTIMNEGGVDTILKLMQSHMDQDEFLPEAIGTLCRLASDEDEDMGKYIAEEGMHTVVEVIEENFDDITVLDFLFKLVGFIAFRKDNVQLIVQQDGVRIVMDGIAKHPDSEKLMSRCIKTLDFIAMADPDYAAIVNAHGGSNIIKKIMAVYPQAQEIQESGKSALLFLEGGTEISDDDDDDDEDDVDESDGSYSDEDDDEFGGMEAPDGPPPDFDEDEDMDWGDAPPPPAPPP